LTESREPVLYLVLAASYSATGSFAKAMDSATVGRDLALAMGQNSLAARLQQQIDQIAARQAQRP
jgi:hypothetical protein